MRRSIIQTETVVELDTADGVLVSNIYTSAVSELYDPRARCVVRTTRVQHALRHLTTRPSFMLKFHQFDPLFSPLGMLVVAR